MGSDPISKTGNRVRPHSRFWSDRRVNDDGDAPNVGSFGPCHSVLIRRRSCSSAQWPSWGRECVSCAPPVALLPRRHSPRSIDRFDPRIPRSNRHGLEKKRQHARRPRENPPEQRRRRTPVGADGPRAHRIAEAMWATGSTWTSRQPLRSIRCPASLR